MKRLLALPLLLVSLALAAAPILEQKTPTSGDFNSAAATLTNKNMSSFLLGVSNLSMAGTPCGFTNSVICMPGTSITGIAQTPASGVISPLSFYISGDAVDTTTSGNGNLVDLSVIGAASTGFTGGRTALMGSMNIVGVPGRVNSAGMVGVSGIARGSANMTGVTGAYANYKGALFGGGFNAYTTSGATFLLELTSQENDVTLATGSSAAEKHALVIVHGLNDAVNATYDDSAIEFADQDGAAVGWPYGISFGSYAHAWPFGLTSSSTATLIGAQLRQAGSIGLTDYAKYGVDWRNITGTSGGAAFISPGWSVDWSGNENAASIGASTPGTGDFTVLTANGVTNINVSNNAATNIGTGSTTSNVSIGNSLNKIVLSGPLQLNGASTSAASWTTLGIGLSGSGTTYTDTSATGTIAAEAIYAFPASAIAATNAITISGLTTLYIPPPAAGANVTATNLYALATPGNISIGGQALFSGGINAFSGTQGFSGGTINLNLNSNNPVNINTGTSSGTTTIGNSSNTGKLILAGVATDSGVTDASLCRRTSDGTVFFGSGTIGICLGTSSARYKHDMQALETGLAAILALKPIRYYLNADHGDRNKPFFGFTAEDMQPVIPELVGMDTEGKPNTADYLGVVPVLVKATQELDAKIDDSRSSLEAKVDRQQIEIYALALLLALSFGFTMYRTRH